MENKQKLALALLIVIIISTALAFFISPESTEAPETSAPTSSKALQ